MRQRRAVSGIAAVAGVIAAAVVPASLGHATTPPAGLRLITGLHHVDVTRYGTGRELFVPAAVYVAPTDGAFAVVVRRRGAQVKIWRAVQRDHRWTATHRIDTTGPVDMQTGIPDFLHLVLRDSTGTTVAHDWRPFCPVGDNGSARVDASGPDRPTFPVLCGSRLTRAMVWGIDRGWADPVALDLRAPSSTVPDGDYTLTVRINRFYAHHLHLDRTGLEAVVHLSVATESQPSCPPKVICEPAHPAMASGTARGAGVGANSADVVAPGVSAGGTAGLPDMAALPARGLRIEHNEGDGHDYLDFAATIWNAGVGPLDVEGFRAGDAERMQARQFVYRDGRSTGSTRIGTFEFDHRTGHHHWHLEDVARYDLLGADRHRVVLSDKQSFCLAPTEPINLVRRDAVWQPDSVGLDSSCPTDESIWLRETLPAGWGDTYVQAKAGQSFDITDLPNGRYLVRITTNPFHRIIETRHDNNSSLVAIDLGGSPGHRSVDRVGVVHSGR